MQVLMPLLPLVPVREKGVFDDGTAEVVAAVHAEGVGHGNAGEPRHEEGAAAVQQAIPAPVKGIAEQLQEPLLASSPPH